MVRPEPEEEEPLQLNQHDDIILPEQQRPHPLADNWQISLIRFPPDDPPLLVREPSGIHPKKRRALLRLGLQSLISLFTAGWLAFLLIQWVIPIAYSSLPPGICVPLWNRAVDVQKQMQRVAPPNTNTIFQYSTNLVGVYQLQVCTNASASMIDALLNDQESVSKALILLRLTHYSLKSRQT